MADRAWRPIGVPMCSAWSMADTLRGFVGRTLRLIDRRSGAAVVPYVYLPGQTVLSPGQSALGAAVELPGGPDFVLRGVASGPLQVDLDVESRAGGVWRMTLHFTVDAHLWDFAEDPGWCGGADRRRDDWLRRVFS